MVRKFIILLLILTDVIWGQINYSGDSYLEYSIDNKSKKTYFEDWTNVSFGYDKIEFNIEYQLHLPPQKYSLDKEGQGIYQRSVRYTTENLKFIIVNFYTMLGSGLTFRSFKNKQLRWDNDIDGVYLNFDNSFFDMKFFGGKIRDLSGDRHGPVAGAEIKLIKFENFNTGFTYVVLGEEKNNQKKWGSIYTKLNFPFGDIYAEIAQKEKFDKNHAVYLSGSFFIKDFIITTEYKDYKGFDITEGATYNTPPTVVKEHEFTLLNRHQRVLNANNEKGYLAEMSYPFFEDNLITFVYSRTDNQKNNLLYEEIFSKVDITLFDKYDVHIAGGKQEDLEARYLNFVVNTTIPLYGNYSLKLDFEHQHEKISLTKRQFYSQLYSLSLMKSPFLTLSLIDEITTDQFSDRKNWFGVQLDMNIIENTDITIFAGNRRKGKICSGGVCVVKPEFKGVEILLTNRF